jgi:hypothetical protein
MKTDYIVLITVFVLLMIALIIILAVKPCSCSLAVPVDCVVSAWTDSSTCSAQNTKTQSRTVKTQAANGGASCPVLTRTVVCPLLSGQPFPTSSSIKNMAFVNNSTVTFTYISYTDSSGGWVQYDGILEPDQTLVLPNMLSYQVYLWDNTNEYGYHGMNVSGKFHTFFWGSTTPSMFSLHETNSEASSFLSSYNYETPTLISSPITGPPVTSWSSTNKIINNFNENKSLSEVTSIYGWTSRNGTLKQIVDGFVLTSNGDYPNNYVINLASLTLNDYVIVIGQSYDSSNYTLYNGLVLFNNNGVFQYIQLFNLLPNLLYISQS